MTWQDFYEQRYLSKKSGAIHRSQSLRRAEHSRIERVICELYPVHVNTRVLDIGAGRASYLNDIEITALDISEEALAESPRRQRVRGEAGALPFDESSFDIVISSQVLEHVPAWRDALREMTRVARTGGLVFIAVPNRYALMKRRYHQLERVIDRAGHINEFREAELYFALIELGLGNVATQGACYDVFWLLSSLERSRHAARWVSILDRIPSHVLARALIADSDVRRRRLSGLSLEVWGYKR